MTFIPIIFFEYLKGDTEDIRLRARTPHLLLYSRTRH